MYIFDTSARYNVEIVKFNKTHRKWKNVKIQYIAPNYIDFVDQNGKVHVYTGLVSIEVEKV